MGAGSEKATHNPLEIRGMVVEEHGQVPGPTRLWEEARGRQNLPRPTLVCFQVRSRDISIEEWKGSETYSPNTAYGKIPGLTLPAGAAAPRPSLQVTSPPHPTPRSQPQRPAQASSPCHCPHPLLPPGVWGSKWTPRERRHLAGGGWGGDMSAQALPSRRCGLPGTRDGLHLPHLPQVLPQQLGGPAFPLQVLGPL